MGPKGSGTKATAGGRLRYQCWAANKTDSVQHPLSRSFPILVVDVSSHFPLCLFGHGLQEESNTS